MGVDPRRVATTIPLLSAMAALTILASEAGLGERAARLAALLAAAASLLGLWLASWIRTSDFWLGSTAATPATPPPGPAVLTPGLTAAVEALRTAATEAHRAGTALGRLQSAIPILLEDLRRSVEEGRIAALASRDTSHEEIQAVKRIDSAWEQVQAMAERIRGQAEDVQRASSGASRSCSQGASSATEAVAEMDRVRAAVSAVEERMRRLDQVADQVGDTARAIDQVSTQINLLALNAAIEAAGAGQFGERFGVVAIEVKQLADRTVSATRMIKELLETVRVEVGQSRVLTEQGGGAVDKGYQRVRDAEAMLVSIREHVTSTDQSAQSILASTRVQVMAVGKARREVQSIQDLLAGAEAGAHRLEYLVGELSGLADRLEAASREKARE